MAQFERKVQKLENEKRELVMQRSAAVSASEKTMEKAKQLQRELEEKTDRVKALEVCCSTV